MKIKLVDSPEDPVRLSFPDLFTPVEYEKGDGKPRYNATYLVKKGGANDKKIQAAIQAVAEEKFGKKAASLLAQFKGNPQKICYLDGDAKEYDGYAGMNYISAHRKAKDGPPFLCDQQKQELQEKHGKPYAGCYVNATVDIYAQDAPNAGIRAGVVGIQFWRDGDAFGGSSKGSADDFDDLCVSEEEDTGGGLI